MDAIARILMQTWMTAAWLVALFPVTVPLLLAAKGLRWSAERHGALPRDYQSSVLRPPILALAAIVALGGAFRTDRVEPPPEHPPAVYAVLLALVVQVALSVAAIVRARPPRRGVAGVLVLMLWAGVVAAGVAYWAIESGATMGAL